MCSAIFSEEPLGERGSFFFFLFLRVGGTHKRRHSNAPPNIVTLLKQVLVIFLQTRFVFTKNDAHDASHLW